MSVIKMCIVFLFGTIIDVQAARVLGYFPTPSTSHQVVFRPIILELLKRGHEVTVITPDPMFTGADGPANLTEIDVHDISYETIGAFTSTITGKESDSFDQMHFLKTIVTVMVEKQVAVEGFKNLIQNRTEKFDLLLLEAFCMPAYGLTHVFNAPTILISSLGAYPGNYEIVGAPTHPTIYHNFFRQRLYNLTVWEKVTEVYNQFRINYNMYKSEEVENKMLQRVFGEDTPPLIY